MKIDVRVGPRNERLINLIRNIFAEARAKGVRVTYDKLYAKLWFRATENQIADALIHYFECDEEAMGEFLYDPKFVINVLCGEYYRINRRAIDEFEF